MSRSTSGAAASKSESGIARYFRDTRAEISKVTWPTREEGTRLTIIVTIATIISGIALFGVDTIFATLVSGLLALV